MDCIGSNAKLTNKLKGFVKMNQILKANQNQQLAKVSAMLSKKLTSLKTALAGSPVTPERFKIAALRCIGDNPKLLQTDPNTLWLALFDAAMLGVELGTTQQLAYVIPYGNDAKLVISYKGMLACAERWGYKTYQRFFVYVGDTFAPNPMERSGFSYIPAPPNGTPRAITHVIVRFEMKDGSYIWHHMSVDEIHKRKEKYARSWQKKDSPWQTEPETMMIKTVIRDAFNKRIMPLFGQEYQPQSTMLESPEGGYVVEDPIEETPAVEPLETQVLTDMLRDCADMTQVDKVQKDLTDAYPDQRQDIYDMCEVRREQIAAVEEQS